MNMGQTEISNRASVWHSLQNQRDVLFHKGPIARGEGHAYHLALSVLESACSPGLTAALRERSEQENLDEALAIFGAAVLVRNDGDYSRLISSLHSECNIDEIIHFSHAWECWESLPDIVRGSKSFDTRQLGQILPLDQQLFRGTHPKSFAYLDGIERLASRHAARVDGWLRTILPSKTGRTLLDLGAGPGVYARTLVDHEIVAKATCVDFEPAVRRARATTSDKVEWIAEDLFALSLAKDARYDVVYIGNVFHHYSLADNAKYLKRIANNLRPGAVIIVQDYLLASEPYLSPLYAAILGVHFALTSTGGRCYSKEEISGVMGEALPKAVLQSEYHLDSADLLLYRCA